MAAKYGTTKYESERQEKSVARDLDAQTVIASGSLWGMKGDVRREEFLVECKTTKESSYRLTLRTWDKIFREALRDNLRTPLMCIDLNNGVNRIAVFESRAFDHDEAWYTLTENCDTVYSLKESFLVDKYESRCFFVSRQRPEDKEHFCLYVVKWDRFINYLDERKEV